AAAGGAGAGGAGTGRAGVGSGWIHIGDAAIGRDGARGEVPGLASWELRFEGGERPFAYLPRGWMYRAPLPRTKALSLIPALRVSGSVTVRGRTLTLDRWPGMVGHNWGAEHAERWIWLHGTCFGGHEDDSWLDLIVGRVRVGPWTTPWVANGCLALDGRRHRLGGIGRVRDTSVDARPEHAELWIPGEDLSLRIEVTAPPKSVVGWIYSDPSGEQHNTAHCAISDLRVRISRRDLPPLELTVAAGGTYELGMRERDHGVPLEPFSDP
ncbi:hypothetical protein Q5424_26435, partial [Conexibacter sp. JD483]|uniref:hypothetical protein n=3 Tax=unclassified Conexibacter TaxID=2627773 RepID=UPI0028703EF6